MKAWERIIITKFDELINEYQDPCSDPCCKMAPAPSGVSASRTLVFFQVLRPGTAIFLTSPWIEHPSAVQLAIPSA